MKHLLVILIACSCSVALAQTGQLAVTVHDPSGKTLGAAQVTISSRPTYVSGAATTDKPTTYNATAVTATTGIAAFTGVPAGAYVICATAPNTQLVDTSSFTEHPPSIYVTAAKSASATVSLIQGALLTVQLNDAQQFLTSASASSRQLRLSVAVPRGPSRPLPRTALTATARQYSLLVPVATPMQIVVGSYGYRVQDANGKSLYNPGSRSLVNFQIPATAGAQTVPLSIVGLL